MSTTYDSHQAFHRGTAPIFAILTPEQTQMFAELQCDETLADRLTELATKANEGLLTASEAAEYDAYIEANNLLAMLQAEARFRLAQREF